MSNIKIWKATWKPASGSFIVIESYLLYICTPKFPFCSILNVKQCHPAPTTEEKIIYLCRWKRGKNRIFPNRQGMIWSERALLLSLLYRGGGGHLFFAPSCQRSKLLSVLRVTDMTAILYFLVHAGIPVLALAFPSLHRNLGTSHK